ncbi:MAG: hypothetical protein NT084_11150 [Bacteroidetes bacterium]|nr:hypothetical protein [Bacteroidota bacterium]
MGFSKFKKIIGDIVKLPIVSVVLDHSEEGHRLFRAFTRLHPRYLIFRQKTIGVALIKLNDFENSEAYTKSVNGKNSAAYFSRKATRAGYTFKSIDANVLTDAIFEINSSAGSRQGREMDDSYKKKLDYPVNENNLYFGVFKDNLLVSYLWVVKSGELAVLNRLLGHADHLNDGIMYFMVTSYVENELTQNGRTRFVMYDTFFGAGDGLKMFKTRCGFNPYRVKWKQS